MGFSAGLNFLLIQAPGAVRFHVGPSLVIGYIPDQVHSAPLCGVRFIVFDDLLCCVLKLMAG